MCAPLFALPMQRIAIYAYAANKTRPIKLNITPIVWIQFTVSPINNPTPIVESPAKIDHINPNTINEFLCIIAGIQNKPEQP